VGDGSTLSTRATLLALAASLLAACSGGIGANSTSGAGAVSEYTIGGTISGLSGAGLVLENNGGDDLRVSGDGPFTFSTPLVTGNSYSITVLAQPSAPSQTCTVANGSGTVAVGVITNITLVCADKTTATDLIGGIVEGLVGSGLVLQDNHGDNLAVSANGPFVFATALASGAAYAVSVFSPPIGPYQDCAVANGAGATGSNDVANVAITCKTNTNPTYTIGGTVTGVTGGSALVLQDNGRDNINVSADGSFQFAIPIPSGSNYSVTSLGASGSQSQACAFTNASGTVAAAAVTNVSIVCKANASIAVTVSGLAGAGLVLQDNGADNLAVTQNGTATFATALAIGSNYVVSVAAQPTGPSQTCVVNNGTGTAIPGSTTSIAVTCTTNAYTVGGTVSGLAGGGLVLQDNGGNNLSVTANGAFVFPAPIQSGGTYTVSVLSQPSALSQTCTVGNGAGTIGGAAVTNVALTCTTNTYSVGVTVSGLAGAGLVLQDNGGDNLAVAANGTFTFATTVPSGGTYNVTIYSQPAGYACAVANRAGVVTSAAVTGVAVACSSIGGYLYVTNGGGNNISGFAIDFNSGALQPLTQFIAATGQPNAIVAATGVAPSSTTKGCFLSSVPGYGLYVANSGSNTISAYSLYTGINSTSPGALTLIANPIATGTTPTYLDFDSSACGLSPALFSLDSGSSDVSAFAASTSGALTQTGSPVGTGANSVPSASANVTFSNIGIPAATYEYVASQGTNNVSAYTVGSGGALTGPNNPIPTGSNPSAIVAQVLSVIINAAIVYEPFVYVANHGSNDISMYQGNAFGGLAALGTPVATGNGPTSMVIVNGALLYVANGLDNTISAYAISPSQTANTGTLTSLGLPPVATGTTPVAMTSAFVNLTTYLYVVNSQSNDVYVYSVTGTTGGTLPFGTLTLVGKYAVGSAPTSVTVPFASGGG
jgi:6-phosphogluconolactonase (cycloisomerase 2 family)